MMRPTAATLLLAIPALTGLRAQDPATAETQATHAPTAKLQAALRTMAELPSVSFACETVKPKQNQQANNPFGAIQINGIGAGGEGSIDGVEGVWTPEVLYATHDDAPMVFANRRMVTEGDDGWVLRSGHTAGGFPAPLVLDPGLWFTLLSTMDLEVIHSDVGTLDDKPIQMLTATLDKEQVAELEWAGLLPANTGDALGMGGLRIARAFAVNIAGGVNAGPKQAPVPERMLDLVFYLDPASNLIHEIKGQRHDRQPEGMGQAVFVVNGGGVVQGGGDDEEEEEEEDDDEAEAAGAPAFKDGFPVRSKKERKKLSSSGWSVKFADHGNAALPEIPGAARKLLGRF